MKDAFIKIILILFVVQLFFGDVLGAGQRNYRFISRSSIGGNVVKDKTYLLHHKPWHGASIAWKEMGSVAWFPSPPHGLKLGVGNTYSSEMVITGDGYPSIETSLDVKVEGMIEMSRSDALFCVWKIDGVSEIASMGDDRSSRMSDLGLRSIFVRGGGAFLLRQKSFVPEVAWMDIQRGGKPDIWSDMNSEDLDLGSHSTAWVAIQ